jgi:hypothetical protein
MTIYAVYPDTIISPTIIIILGSLVWLLALLDVGVDFVFPRDRHVDQAPQNHGE